MLDMAHTCDRCGATAHNRWIHGKTGLDVLLCDHHSRESRAKLIHDGFREAATIRA